MSHAAPIEAERFIGRVAIVGNDPALGDISATADAADHVVRFNNAPGFGGHAGSRVTHLALVNRGGQMRAWLDDPAFLERPVTRATRAILLPFPEMMPEHDCGPVRVCWTQEAQARLAGLAVPVRVLTQDLHDAARAALRAANTGREPNPSTGFLIAFHVLRIRRSEDKPVEVFGFGFAGWPGHPWDAERRWFETAHAAGRLRLHPLNSS